MKKTFLLLACTALASCDRGAPPDPPAPAPAPGPKGDSAGLDPSRDLSADLKAHLERALQQAAADPTAFAATLHSWAVPPHWFTDAWKPGHAEALRKACEYRVAKFDRSLAPLLRKLAAEGARDVRVYRVTDAQSPYAMADHKTVLTELKQTVSFYIADLHLPGEATPRQRIASWVYVDDAFRLVGPLFPK